MRDGGRFGSTFTGIKAGMLFVGSIIGAGFASGKEILTFFAGNNIITVFTVILAGVLFYLTGLLFFNLGRRINAGSLFKFTEIVLKKYGNIFNFFITFCYLVLLAAMLAGVDSLAGESIGYNGLFPVFSIVMLIISVSVVKNGIKGLLDVNGFLVPAVIFFLAFVCIFTLSKGAFWDSGSSIRKETGFFVSVYQCLLYVSLNMLLSSAVMISAGRDMDSRQIKTASFIASVIITALLALILVTCRLNYSLIQGMDMPLVLLALRISPVFKLLSVVIMSFAIFTTLISSMYPLKEFFLKIIPNENTVYIILCAAGFLLSRVGFSYIVTYMYPVQGLIGAVFIIYCVSYYIKEKMPDFKLKNLKSYFSKDI